MKDGTIEIDGKTYRPVKAAYGLIERVNKPIVFYFETLTDKLNRE